MSSDDDEIEEHTLSPEEIAEIVEWAVGTSALAALMFDMEVAHNEQEMKDAISAYETGISLMIYHMPEVLSDPAVIRANQAVDKYMMNEEIVEEFVREIEEFNG